MKNLSQFFLILNHIIISYLFCHIKFVNGHGMMLEPTGRASRWRFDRIARINYNDNELFCGGTAVQWNINNGKCGLCGDDYRMETPRPHEFGGKYGEGVIVKSYKQADGLIPIGVKITANHRGTFHFDVCNMDADKESEECFEKNKLNLEDGSPMYTLTRYEQGWFNTTLRIPDGLECEHCVLRWTYRTGNNWGLCDDGRGALGCGPQEHFRSCADISIVA